MPPSRASENHPGLVPTGRAGGARAWCFWEELGHAGGGEWSSKGDPLLGAPQVVRGHPQSPPAHSSTREADHAECLLRARPSAKPHSFPRGYPVTSWL